MASTKEIKRRIKSVKSTKKITKAMELVAASKMKRAVSQTLSSRLYANYSWDLLTSLSEKLGDNTHSFFNGDTNAIGDKYSSKKRPDKTLIILMTSNRGLCGGYNSQVIKKTIAMLKEEIAKPTGSGDANPIGLANQIDFITVGKKGDSAMRRTGQNVIATFVDIPDAVTLRDIVPLSTLITNEFKERNYKNVYVAYTDFISALNQKPHIKKLLPISKEEMLEILPPPRSDQGRTTPPQAGGESFPSLDKEGSPTNVGGGGNYLLEGNVNKLLMILAERLVRMQIYQMLLESNASEQSSRMVAMKNANEAAGEMIDDLTLVFNKARQSNITREISEISAGMASVG